MPRLGDLRRGLSRNFERKRDPGAGTRPGDVAGRPVPRGVLASVLVLVCRVPVPDELLVLDDVEEEVEIPRQFQIRAPPTQAEAKADSPRTGEPAAAGPPGTV